MPRLVDDDAISALQEMIEEPVPPPPTGRRRGSPRWTPKLSEDQQEAFDSPARFLLCDGEKGSGKTWGLLHKLMRHLYENKNALALIGVKTMDMATKGGAWDKLVNEVAPAWRDGLGIHVSPVKYDLQHHPYIWVENRFGFWCMVVLISCPHANQLRDRMRGYEPSFVLWDELTSTDSREYLTAVAIQVGRRNGVEGPQQYTAACNPDGPDHWVHQVWMVEAFNEETGEWDPDYHRIHVRIEGNKDNLQPGYIEGLHKLYKNDPVDAARMLRGEWVARPSGTALFKEHWLPSLLVKPAPESPDFIVPFTEHPVILGLDPGSVHNAFVFMQYVPIEGALRWLIFDEVVYIRRPIPYRILMPVVVRRLWWWEKPAGGHLRSVWSSDDSAFNQFRAAGGSYDVWELEKAANAMKRPGDDEVRIRPAPKFANSREARVRMVMDLLGEQRIWVSPRCKKVQAMFANLEGEKKAGDDAGMTLAPKKTAAGHIHVFDATSYPMMTAQLRPDLLTPPATHTQTITPIRD